ncbi:reverse transcriptase domain-containing protein [Tanacetum coccineum]
MADNRTMAQMLQAPIEGYEDAIVVPPINANNFELKQTLINLVQSNQFTEPNETFNEAWERFKGLLRQCPHHGFSELHQLDTFYNSLNTNDQDALDSAAGGNFLDKMPRDGLAIIKSKSKVRYSRSRAIEPRVSMNAPLSTSTPSNSFEFQQIAASLEDKMDIRMSRLEKMISEKNVMTPATVKAVEEVCVTCEPKNPETSTEKVQNPNLENTAHVPPLEEEDSIFIEIPKPKAKKNVNVEIQDLNSPRPNSYQSKLPYPERMKVRENDKLSAQHSRFLKMFKQLRLEIRLKDALVKMPKFNKWLSSLLKNKEKLEEIDITTVNAECSAIIMNKVLEKLEDPRKILIPCALQELNRTSALADSRASINLLPHSIYKKLRLEALTPTRMTLELANRFITHPMGIAEDVVVRVDGRPFLRTAKALIDLYEETLTLRVGKEDLVYYADKSEKNKNKHFVHAISVIDFSKDDPFSGSTTTHSDDPSPSSSPVKTSDNFEKFADELAPLDSLPPGNDDSTLKKDLHKENFQVYSNPLFEFDDNFKSSTINPLFDEMEEDVEIKNSNVSDEPVLLNTPLSDKVECFAPEDDNDEIDAFLAMEVSSNFEEGYFDSEGDITFLDNLLSDDASHNLASEVISDHEPEQNESSITFSPRSDPLHHEFAGELLTLPSRNDHEFGEYLSLMTVLCEISTSQSQENVHANQSLVIESLPVSPIPVEDSEPAQEEIDIFLVPDDLIPPGVENDDSEDEDNELPNLDHQDDPSIPRPPPEPPDVEKCFEPEAEPPDECLNFEPIWVMKNVVLNEDLYQSKKTLPLNVEDVDSFTFIIWTFLPHFTYTKESPLIFSFRSENFVFDPGIEDEIILAKEQPLPAIASSTADSLGYVPESDPEEEPEEDDEDPEEDPADYPADRDDDDDDEDEDEDEEEEEHPAPADSVPPVHRMTARISIRDEPSISLPPREEVERLLALTTPPPSPLTPLSSPLPHIPSPPLPASPPLQLLSSDHRTDRPEITLPPRKRLGIDLGPRYEIRGSSAAAATRPIRGRRADYGFVGTMDTEIRRQRAEEVGYGIRDVWVDPREAVEEVAPMTLGGVNTRVTELTAVQEQDTQDIYAVIEDTQDRQTQIYQSVGTLVDDSQYHYETARLLDQEALVSREAWGRSIEVRIYQKSQENHQKQENTDTRTEEHARAGSQSQKVNPGQTSGAKGLTLFTLLPRFTPLSNQRAFPNWRVRKSIQVVYITLAELKRHSSTLLANSKRMPRGLKEAQDKRGFTLLALSEKAQGVTITDCYAGNPCVHICDPTAKTNDPIIEGIQGM